jgi:hypothetical protein
MRTRRNGGEALNFYYVSNGVGNEKKDDQRADFLKFSIRFDRYYLLSFYPYCRG